jgi:hypothetical protein
MHGGHRERVLGMAAAPGVGEASIVAFTPRERKLLSQRVQDLGPTEHQQIFEMLQAHGVKYMENNNGCFVNISTAVPDELLREVERFVAFCIANKSSLDEYDKNLNECKLGLSAGLSAGGGGGGGGGWGGGGGPAACEAADAAAPGVDAGGSKDNNCPQGGGGGGVGGGAGAAGSGGGPPPPPVLLPAEDNAKYSQARKKFAKRKVQDKKGATFGGGKGYNDPHATSATLVPEPYTYTPQSAAVAAPAAVVGVPSNL